MATLPIPKVFWQALRHAALLDSSAPLPDSESDA
jgi:hypothetical protein